MSRIANQAKFYFIVQSGCLTTHFGWNNLVELARHQ
jgi:hypothetical protein